MQNLENIISCVRIKPLINKDEEVSCTKYDERSVLLLKANEKYNFGSYLKIS